MVIGEKGVDKSILTRAVLNDLRAAYSSTTLIATVDCRRTRSWRQALVRPPLGALGAGRMDVQELGRRTADPVELLMLGEGTLAHRLEFLKDGHREEDWTRSLNRATGARLADRLGRVEGEELRGAAEALTGLGGPGAEVLRQLELAYGTDEALRIGPLGRSLDRPSAITGLREGLPVDAWSEAAREEARGREEAELVVPAQVVGLSPAPREGAHPGMLSMGRLLRGLVEGELPEVIEDALEALDGLEGEDIRSPEQARALVAAQLRALQVQIEPGTPRRALARLLGFCLRIAAVRHPDDLADQERALAELERLLVAEGDGWQARVRAEALYAVAKALMLYRRVAADLDRAEALARTASALMAGDGDIEARFRAIAAGLRADVLVARGELEEALRIRREQELPVYERIGDVRERATAMGKIADIHQVRGELDEALRIRREEELPIYERLGAPKSLLFGRTNLALLLLQRNRTSRDRREARTLLAQARAVAEQLHIPEAQTIREIQARQGWQDDPAPAP